MAPSMVIVGRLVGLHGVAGWLKVESHTSPRRNLLGYAPLHVRLGDEWHEYTVAGGREHGKRLTVHLAGVDDRDAAARLVGCEVAVARTQLPDAGPDEYYWSDLEGLRVECVDGTPLGAVAYLLDTGANDVMVVRGERERLIPFVRGQVVQAVDLDAGTIRVDWDPEF